MNKKSLLFFKLLFFFSYYTAALLGFMPFCYDGTTYEAKPCLILRVYSSLWTVFRMIFGPYSNFVVFLDLNMWNEKLIATSSRLVGLTLSFIVCLVCTIVINLRAKKLAELYNEAKRTRFQNFAKLIDRTAVKYGALISVGFLLDMFAVLNTGRLRDFSKKPKLTLYLWWWIRLQNLGFVIGSLYMYVVCMMTFNLFLLEMNKDLLEVLNIKNPRGFRKNFRVYAVLEELVTRYKQIYRFTNSLHSDFELQVAVYFLYVYINTLSTTFFVFFIELHYKTNGVLDRKFQTLEIHYICFACADLYQAFLIFYSSSCLYDISKKTRDTINTFLLQNTDEYLDHQVEPFSMLVGSLDYNLDFCGMFNARTSDFYDFVQSLIMSLIVLLQFDDGESFLAVYSLADIFGNMTINYYN